MFKYIYIYIYIYIHANIYLYQYVYININVCVCMCVNFWYKNRYIFIAVFKFTVNRFKLFVCNFKILYANKHY